MSEGEDVTTVTARGAMILVLGDSSALMIGAAGILLLARLLSPAAYGQYTLALIPSSFFVLFTDWGIDTAFPRFLVHMRMKATPEELRSLVWSGLVAKWLIGLVFAALLVFGSEMIATQVLNRPDLGSLIQVSAIVVVGQPLYQTVYSICVGFERMGHRSSIAILQASIKAIVAPLLVVAGFGVTGAVGGHALSVLLAAAFGVSITWRIAGPLYPYKRLWALITSAGRLIRFGLPLFAVDLVRSMVEQIRLILLPWFVADATIGNFQVAQNFTMLLFSLTSALGIALYPTFSRFSFALDAPRTRQIYRTAVRYCALLVIPVTLLLVTVAKPLIEALYTTQYPDATGFFILLVLPGLLSGWGLYGYRAWLISQGDTRGVFIIQGLFSVISLLSAVIGLTVSGMLGFLLSLIVSFIVMMLMALFYLHHRYGIVLVFPHTLRVLTVAGIATIVTSGLLAMIPSVSAVIMLSVGTSLYLALILILSPLLGALTPRDVQLISAMFSGQRVVGSVVRYILGWEAKLLAWFARARN